MALTVPARLLAARGLRSFADGMISILLPAHLLALGFDAFQVGLLNTATFLGSALLTLAVGLWAHRFERRSLLFCASALMAATGAGFAGIEAFGPLLLVAFVGTLNPSSGDVSVFLPLEQAALAGCTGDEDRTRRFAHYSLAGTLASALGALAAGLPQLLVDGTGLADVLRWLFLAYGALGAVGAFLYRGLPRTAPGTARPQAALGPSKGIVYRLAALFSLDSFAGGFIVQSMLALWLFQRFELDLAAAGTFFFAANLLSALSFLAAVRLAGRIGLINTMVFSHLPANVLLIAAAFAPSLEWVLGLLLVRSALSQMDVPTRTSYVMAVVTPEERPAAAGITAVPRSLASALSPSLGGWMLAVSSFGWPLVVAGSLKIAYDLMLLVSFRHHRPPEECRRSD